MSRKTKTFPFLWKTLPLHKMSQKILMANLVNSYWYFYDFYFNFLAKFEMLQNAFHNSHYLDQKSAGNLKLSSSFSQNLLTVAIISTSFVNFPYNISQCVMKKSGNHSLGVKCHKNPSLKCQIFKTFPFPGERNKDKYLPLAFEVNHL